MSHEADASWQIIIHRKAERILKRLPRPLKERLIAAIDALAHDPRPPGCKKLVGQDELYRLRVGDWRIIYAVEDDKLIILIVKVAPRGSAYRDG